MTNGRQRGVLKLTLWPQQRRLWLLIQDGRRGDWVDAAAKQLKQAIEQP